jgi:hypothetical protein
MNMAVVIGATRNLSPIQRGRVLIHLSMMPLKTVRITRYSWLANRLPGGDKVMDEVVINFLTEEDFIPLITEPDRDTRMRVIHDGGLYRFDGRTWEKIEEE